MTHTTHTREKVLNACHRLNAEAYARQAQAKRSRKPLKQFTPCAKSETLMAHLRKGIHFGTCHELAAVTHCECHPSLDNAGLMDYEYDDTYKLAHYAGDVATLYPNSR